MGFAALYPSYELISNEVSLFAMLDQKRSSNTFKFNRLALIGKCYIA